MEECTFKWQYEEKIWQKFFSYSTISFLRLKYQSSFSQFKTPHYEKKIPPTPPRHNTTKKLAEQVNSKFLLDSFLHIKTCPFFYLVLVLFFCQCNKGFFIIPEFHTQEDNVFKLESNQLSYSKSINRFAFSLNVENTKSVIESKINIFGKDKRLICNLGDEVNVSQKHYKLYQADKIIALSKHFSENNQLSIAQLKSIYAEMQLFFDKTRAKVNNNYNALLANSTSYYMAIIATSIRSKEFGNSCECTTHMGYLVDKNYFICMEDDTLNVVELKKIVNSRDYIDSFKNNTQALNFASYLKHINKSRIAAIDILEHYIPKKIYTKVLQYIRTPDTITTKILTPSKNGISLFTYSTDLSIRAGITFAMDFRPQVEAIAIPIVKQEFAGISEV